MARARAQSTAATDNLVHQALLKIALSEAPLRLTGKGEDAIFASASAASKAAMAVLKAERQPLIVEGGTGKNLSVSLTQAGFERIREAIPAEKLLPVVERFGRELPPPERVSFLQWLIQRQPEACAPLLPLLEEALAAERADIDRQTRARAQERAAENATLAALKRWETLLIERKRQRARFLKQQLQAEGVEEELVESPPPARQRDPVRPDEPEDEAFQRNVARRLVSSWVDAWESQKKDAREFLESAIWNISGFRSLGEVGQAVRFDGRYHDGGAGLFTNDPVRIVRPGWILDEANEHEYIIQKALVTKQ